MTKDMSATGVKVLRHLVRGAVLTSYVPKGQPIVPGLEGSWNVVEFKQGDALSTPPRYYFGVQPSVMRSLVDGGYIALGEIFSYATTHACDFALTEAGKQFGLYGSIRHEAQA